MRIVLVALLLLAAGGQAGASIFDVPKTCPKKPIKPACVDSFRTYEDPEAHQRCQAIYNRYSRAMLHFTACLSARHDEASKEFGEFQRNWICRSAEYGLASPVGTMCDEKAED